MKQTIILMMLLLAMANTSCEQKQEATKNKEAQTAVSTESPNQMLAKAYQLFKEGNDEESIDLANQVLAIGRASKNDTLIGRALTSLCRNSQRKQDTVRLAELSEELSDLAASSGNQKWLMYMAHMNAEMYRLIGNMDKAEMFYNQSMKISYETGALGMYTIDHFNMSFVAIAKGDFENAKALIKKYYQLRKEDNPDYEDAYGLIALSYLLEQEKNYKGAHEVATVTRRLFKQQNLFPEPPDEKPLLMVEAKVKQELSAETLNEIGENSRSESVSSLLEKYLD